MQLPSFMVATAKTSILLNGIYVKFNALIDILQRFCQPLTLHNSNSIYEISPFGSSFLVEYKTRKFRLFTRHQLGNGEQAYSPEKVLLIFEDYQSNRVGLSPSNSFSLKFNGQNEKSLEDLAIVEYSQQIGGADIERFFYKLDLHAMSEFDNTDNKKIVAIFAIGYPSRFLTAETSFDEEYLPTEASLNVGYAPLFLERANPSPWDIEYRTALQAHHRYNRDVGDPDGFSGAPVFYIYEDEARQSHLGFAGIITDGSKEGRFNIYRASDISRYLIRACS